MAHNYKGSFEKSVSVWKEVIDVCKDAAIFLDNGVAELLLWAGGLELLENCNGIYDVYQDLNSIAMDIIATVSTNIYPLVELCHLLRVC